MKHATKILLATLVMAFTSARAEDPLISTSGQGQIKIAPDVAYINLRAQTKAKDAKSARKKNAEEINRITEILESNFKIDKKDVQTSNFDLSPDYRYEQNGKSTLLGFRVNHTLTLRLKNLERAGEVIDKLVVPGTEDKMLTLQGITFDTDKRKEYELKALEFAMADAHARAETLAKLAKRSLGPVTKVFDRQVTTSEPSPVREKVFMAHAMSAATSTNISAGELAVQAEVSVEYLLK